MKKEHKKYSKKESRKDRKINWNVVIYSIIALGFIALTFLVDWMFIIGAVVMIWLNQRELMGKRKEQKRVFES
jgi:hypothetical protein